MGACVSNSASIDCAMDSVDQCLHATAMFFLLRAKCDCYFCASRFCALATCSFMWLQPTFTPFLWILLDQAEAGVTELDERSAVSLAQPVLHVVGDRLDMKQRTAEFKQRGPLDGLHIAPRSGRCRRPGRGTSVRRATARSFIGMAVPSGISLPGPSCSNRASNVTSIGALTWISCVTVSERLSISDRVVVIVSP